MDMCAHSISVWKHIHHKNVTYLLFFSFFKFLFTFGVFSSILSI